MAVLICEDMIAEIWENVYGLICDHIIFIDNLELQAEYNTNIF